MHNHNCKYIKLCYNGKVKLFCVFKEDVNMTKMRMRIVSLLVGMAMVLAMLPMTAFAIKIIDTSDKSKPESTEGKLVIMNETFEDDKVGKNPAMGGTGFTTGAYGVQAAMNVFEEENGNKYLTLSIQ